MTSMMFIFMMMTFFLVCTFKFFMKFFFSYKSLTVLMILVYLMFYFLVIFNYFDAITMSLDEKMNMNMSVFNFFTVHFYIDSFTVLYLIINFMIFLFIIFFYLFDIELLNDINYSINLMNYVLSFNGLSLIFIISNNMLVNYIIIWMLQVIFYKLLILVPPAPEYKINSKLMNNLMMSVCVLSDFLILCSMFIMYLYFKDFNFDSLRSMMYSMYMNDIGDTSSVFDKLFILFGSFFDMLSIFYLITYINIFLKFLYLMYWITYLPRFMNITVVLMLTYQALFIVLLSFFFFYKCDTFFEYYLLFDFNIYNIFKKNVYTESFSYMCAMMLFIFWAVRSFFVMYKWHLLFHS